MQRWECEAPSNGGRISPEGRIEALPGLAARLAMCPCLASRLQGLRAGPIGHFPKLAAMVRAPCGQASASTCRAARPRRHDGPI